MAISEDGKVHTFTAENEVVRGGIAIEKQDSQTGTTPQGNADFSGITFEIVNRSANPVIVDGLDYAPGAVVATLTTDSEGKASTADDALPFGRYEVRESATNDSMLLTFQPQTVTISENKKVYPVTARNDVVRGGLSLEKRDTITGSTPQGDADFAGIKFEIINKSRNPVIVGGSSYAPDEVVMELTTDSEGKASTANDALPYWSWYGFGSRVEWCACFVSWCANQCGYIENGICPKFAGCTQGSQWFKNRGQWLAGSATPYSGMIIFFDWDLSGDCDHVGIVEKVENGRVYTIEGNSGNACRRCSYPVGYSQIVGYGVLSV